MNKVVAALALLSASSVMAVGTDCTTNTAVATALGLKASDLLSVSAAASEATYCTNLKTDSCCSAATINTFKTKADALVDTVAGLVGTRDKYLIGLRKNSLDDIASELATLKKAAAAAVAKLGASAESLSEFEDQLDFLTGSSSELISSFTTYQKARATCAKKLIELQAAAWCLACDPVATTTKGVSGAAISLAAAAKTELETACYPYISNSVEQNLIVKFNILADKLTAYTNALNAIASSTSGTSTALNAFLLLASSLEVTNPPSLDSQKPVSLPANCDSDDCTWIYTTMWDAANGGLDNDVLAAGGELIDYVVDDDENENEDETSGNRRVLAANEFTPDYTATGITVTFPENPGNVDNSKSAQLIEGAVVCAGVLAMGLMI